MLNFQALGWPPDCDARRLRDYQRFEQMFSGNHAKAFADLGARVPEGYRNIIYIAVNLAGLLTKKTADFLVGEAPVFRAGDPGSPEQAALDTLLAENGLRTMLYEGALSASFRGDLIIRARVGTRQRNADPQVIIEEIPSYSYFVERDPDNVRNVLSESIAWVRASADGRQKFLRVETHEPGKIHNTAYRLSESGAKVNQQIALASLYPDGEAPPEEEDTGVDASLLVHIPNYRHGSLYYGISDYGDGLESLFDAVNNRLSKIDAILDKHSSPKLVGVAGMSDPSGIVDVAKLDYVEADSEIFKHLPRYVTWEGHLESALLELEQLLLLICAVGEIAPAAIGLNIKDGATAESGKALQLRYVTMAQKCNRKRLYFDPGVKRALRIASQLGAARLNRVALDEDPEILWQDGLPQIYSEAVETEALRVGSGLSSKESAIQRIDQGTPEQARAELERIIEEQAAARKANPDPFGVGGGGGFGLGLEDAQNGGRENQKPQNGVEEDDEQA